VKIGLLLTFYLLINLAYTYKLKQYAVIDVTIIAIGFIIRIFIGGFAGDIVISKWFILMVYLLSLTPALGKRRDDLLLQEENDFQGNTLRNSLNGYSMEFINFSISMLSIISVLCYIMYTVSPEVALRQHSDLIYLTSFPVIMGFIRYFQKAYVHKDTGSPTKLLLTDKQMQFWVFMWVATYAFLQNVKF
jgi:4-hydroxybenzoate polyprenyltransferase